MGDVWIPFVFIGVFVACIVGMWICSCAKGSRKIVQRKELDFSKKKSSAPARGEGAIRAQCVFTAAKFRLKITDF